MKTTAIKGMYLTKNKSKSGNTYTALVFDLGYTKHFICFKAEDCAKLLGITAEQFYNVTEKMQAGDSIPIEVG